MQLYELSRAIIFQEEELKKIKEKNVIKRKSRMNGSQRKAREGGKGRGVNRKSWKRK